MAEAFAASKGRYGYRRIKAMLRTGVSEKVIRRIMAEDGLTAHVPERRGYGSYGGETTPAPGNLVTRDFTAKLPNEKWLTDITRDQGPGREDVPLRRRSTATMARSSRMRPVPVPTPGLPTGCSSGPWKRCRRERIPWCVPPRPPLPVARMAGAHGPLRPDTVDGRKGLFPGRRRRGGVLRSNEDGVRPSRALGGAYP